MDVGHLALLRELRDRGTITAVASATHRSASAVSQQLKTFERHLGVQLVRRNGRGVELTDAGRSLAESSVAIATAMAEAEARWERFRDGAGGTVTVAIFPSASELFAPGLVTRMLRHPSISVHLLDEDPAEDAFARLTADADIVVGHRSEAVAAVDRGDLVVEPLLREPLDVGIPLGHPLAARDAVSMTEVAEDAWIGVPVDYPIDRALVALGVVVGVVPRVVHRTVHLPVIEAMVAAGVGIALLPRYTSRSRAAGRFRLVALENVRAARHIEALMRPDRAARGAVQTVLAALVDEAATISAP